MLPINRRISEKREGTNERKRGGDRWSPSLRYRSWDRSRFIELAPDERNAWTTRPMPRPFDDIADAPRDIFYLSARGNYPTS